MHCLVQPIDRIFVKGYIFLSFPKYMCKNIGESESKHLSDTMAKILLFMLNNPQQMHFKLLQKE